MRYLGKVLEVFSATKEESSLPRPVVEELELIKGHGIKNDKFAKKDENKSVMMVGLNAYELASEHGIDLKQGTFGENILLDFNPHELPFGSIVFIEDAKISIIQNCTVCDHLAVFDKKLPKIAKGKRGVYCKIEANGVVKKGMKVYIKDEK